MSVIWVIKNFLAVGKNQFIRYPRIIDENKSYTVLENDAVFYYIQIFWSFYKNMFIIKSKTKIQINNNCLI